MPSRLSVSQRDRILSMLAEGREPDEIAATVGVSPGQVSAVSAHVTMGTYDLPTVQPTFERPRTEELDTLLAALEESTPTSPRHLQPVPIGSDVETGELAHWDPDASSGTTNAHVLILGESGYGKTYAICCLLAELSRQNLPCIVFDYGQGFVAGSAPAEFLKHARLNEIRASEFGISINPLTLFSSDTHGPVNVAQRIADTVRRVYAHVGVQQHAILRDAVLDTFAASGITPESRDSWGSQAPTFDSVHTTLLSYAADPKNIHRRIAASLASHISTLFVFNTFRHSGLKVSWQRILDDGGRIHVVQLKGLEQSLERAVTELLLWNLIGYLESLGPGAPRCCVVLDEAHRLAFTPDSPSEKLIREGRKYGIGLLLASQQPSDFTPVVFANTATKLIFQISDRAGQVAKQVSQKVMSHSLAEISTSINRLPRGCAFLTRGTRGQIVRVDSMPQRVARWHHS